MLVVVWPRRSVRGWDGSNDPESFSPRDLGAALSERYDTDAHFVPYVVVDADGVALPEQPRVNKAAVTELEARGWSLAFSAVVMDIDDPVAHREGGAAGQDWRYDQDDLYGDLPLVLFAGMARYDTRGGYRLLWKLDQPLEPDAYLALAAGLRRELATYGIIADDLKDWGRCYRLPYVLRDGERQEYDADLDQLHRPLRWRLAASTSPFAGIAAVELRRSAVDASQRIAANRNMTLTRLAGGWRRTGLPEATILDMLRAVNTAQCVPPLEDAELEKIARSIMRYDPEPEPADTGVGGDGDGGVNAPVRIVLGDEVELAGVVADRIEGDGERLVFDRSELWQYGAGIWSAMSPAAVRSVCHEYSGAQIPAGRDREGNPRYRPLKVSSRFSAGVLQVVQIERNREGWLDGAPTGLMFGDQFVRIDDETHEIVIEDPSPENRQLAALPFEFVPGALPWAFLAMLHEIWRDDDDVREKEELLREWIGAALLGQSPRYQRALILAGTGANGKSTVQTILSALFPPGTVTAIAPQDMECEYRRARLAGARLNCVSELPEADILVSGPVKAMISGDLISARHIRESPFDFRPTVAHLFSANMLPGVRDMSVGFWRRWIVLEFNRAFAPHEQDRGLAERVVSTELAEIASWAVAGAAQLAARGHYADPDSSVISLASWRKQADQLSSFIDAACETAESDDEYTAAASLYHEYVSWATLNGHHRLSSTRFGKRLKALGVGKKRKSSGVFYALSVSS